MKQYILPLLAVLLIAPFKRLAAQDDGKKRTKVIVIKKHIDEDGEVTVDKVVKEGEEAERFLEEELELEGFHDMDIDVDEILEDENIKIKFDHDFFGIGEIDIHHELPENVESIDIRVDEEDGEIVKRYKVVRMDENGKLETLEWDGTGDMPEELKDALGDYSIDNGHVIVRDANQRVMSVTKNVEDGEKRVKIKIVKGDGDTEVIEWEGDGEIPEHIHEKLKAYKSCGDAEKGSFSLAFDDDALNRALLGVHVENEERGAKVIKVEDASAASEAGIEVGDIITRVDDHAVADLESLIEALKAYEPGDDVNVSLLRDETNTRVKAVLKERAAAPQWTWKSHDMDIGANCFVLEPHTGKKEVYVIKRRTTKEPANTSPETIEVRQPPIPKAQALKLNDFNAFPNPTDGVINVSFQSEKSPVLIQIMDVSGREIYRHQVQDFDGYYNEDIDLSDAGAGNYILYVIQSEKLYTHQLALN